MSKKGMIFTISAVLLAMLLITAMKIRSYDSLEYRQETVKTRVSQMNYFIYDIEKDISRAGMITGKRSLLALSTAVIENGRYRDDAKKDLVELFLNGTIDGSRHPLMNGSTLATWCDKLKEIGNKLNMNTSIIIKSVTIEQQQPFTVIFNVKSSVKLTDKNNIASYEFNMTIPIAVDITGLEDPLYSMNTNGKVSNFIYENKKERLVTGNDTAELKIHLENQYYIGSTKGPDYIHRLEGKRDADIFGIESLVNKDRFAQNKIQVHEKSNVDHIYFSSRNTTNYQVTNMPDSFLLDESHLAIYDCEYVKIGQ